MQKKVYAQLPPNSQFSFSKDCENWFKFNETLSFSDYYSNYDESKVMFYRLGDRDVPALYNGKGHALIGSSAVVLTNEGVMTYSDQVLSFYGGNFNRYNLFGFLGKLSRGKLKSSLDMGYFKGRPGLYFSSHDAGGITCLVKYPDDTNCISENDTESLQISGKDLQQLKHWHDLVCTNMLSYNIGQIAELNNFAIKNCSSENNVFSIDISITKIQNLCALVEEKIISKIR